MDSEKKVFNDPIHSSIQMPIYCQMIIDTPEFQRLRFIKQLGCTCYVFPTAVHTRFDHSIGVSHLAGKLANAIKQSNPNINKSLLNNEVACVEIAGLCHDLGHGPFSHAFEDIIPPDAQGKKWKHEDQSVVVFQYLIEQNNLKSELKNHGIYNQEIEFICELILGRSLRPDTKLIRENKYYLYQIVNNSVNGVDVDKWDYFARDTYFLGMQSAFNFNRLIPFVRVFDVTRSKEKPRKELCFRDKVTSDLNHMFLTRRRLHYAAYQHRVSKIITIMLKDAFLAANEHIKFIGTNGKEFNLFESVQDPKAFCQVNDSVVNEIMRSRSDEPGMVKAKEIIDRIHRRKLYVCVLEVQHANEELNTTDAAEIKRRMTGDDGTPRPFMLSVDSQIWLPQNIEVEVSCFEYGKDDNNPLLEIPFYSKSHQHDQGEHRASFLPRDKLPADLPQRLKDVTVRMYTKVPDLKDKDLEEIKKYFGSRAKKRLHREPPGTPVEQPPDQSEESPSSPHEDQSDDVTGAEGLQTRSPTELSANVHGTDRPSNSESVFSYPGSLHSRDEPYSREQRSQDPNFREPEARVTHVARLMDIDK